MTASERDDEEARAAWREGVAALDPKRLLVFVDECGSNVGLAPLRARAPKGERAHGKTPRNRGKNTTTLLLASMGAGGMCGAFPGRRGRYDQGGGVRGPRWGLVLAPSLSSGEEVVVMDNLSGHKGDRVRELEEEARGWEVSYCCPHTRRRTSRRWRRPSRSSQGAATPGGPPGTHEGDAPRRRSSKRSGERSRRSRWRTREAGSATAATRSLSHCENR